MHVCVGECVCGGGGEEGDYMLLLHCQHQNAPAEMAAMRAILMFRNCEGQSHKNSVH